MKLTSKKDTKLSSKLLMIYSQLSLEEKNVWDLLILAFYDIESDHLFWTLFDINC
jgi:hypothetical protein